MIVVKIELWPGGREPHAKEIGRMYITNVDEVSDANPKFGNYRAAVCRRGSTKRPAELFMEDENFEAAKKALPKATRTGKVENYPRASYNVWRLVFRCLKSCFSEEK